MPDRAVLVISGIPEQEVHEAGFNPVIDDVVIGTRWPISG